MSDYRQQADLAVRVGGTLPPAGIVEQFRANIAAAGLSPRKTLLGWLIAWGLFFFILYGMPAPAGLTAAGQATLAVMVWACTMWIFEAIPVGISGILIPMLLVMTNAVKPFPKAADGFTTPVVFLCLAAFLFAAIMQAAGLDRRIALSLLHSMKVKTVNGVIWAMFAVNLVLSLIIPAANARAATLLPVINGITNFFPARMRARRAPTTHTGGTTGGTWRRGPLPVLASAPGFPGRWARKPTNPSTARVDLKSCCSYNNSCGSPSTRPSAPGRWPSEGSTLPTRP